MNWGKKTVKSKENPQGWKVLCVCDINYCKMCNKTNLANFKKVGGINKALNTSKFPHLAVTMVTDHCTATALTPLTSCQFEASWETLHYWADDDGCLTMLHFTSRLQIKLKAHFRQMKVMWTNETTTSSPPLMATLYRGRHKGQWPNHHMSDRVSRPLAESSVYRTWTLHFPELVMP